VRLGVNQLPTLGDGRQSGTSASASILHVSPEAAAGGNLALLQTGDRIHVDFNARTVNVLWTEADLAQRRAAFTAPPLHSATPWQELYRQHVAQLEDGGVLEFAVKYHNVGEDVPRHNH
jgi:dihydroxy-acid dehydratase